LLNCRFQCSPRVFTGRPSDFQGRGPDDLIFGDGQRYLPRPKSDGGWFVGTVKRAKVQNITAHDLRHAAASIAVSAGANVLALSRMLGHKDPSVTLPVYADLFDSDLDAVGAAIDSAAIDSKCAQSVPKPVPVPTLPAAK